MTLVVYSSFMPVPADQLFEFHMDAENLVAISPPFPPFRLLSPTKRAEVGDLQVMRVGSGVLAIDWEARIVRIVPGRLMEDRQERGPFMRWRHQHRSATAPGGSRLTDAVSFRLAPTPVGEFLEYWFARPMIVCMFAFRHRRTRRILAHSKS